jgi:hypothetical protein
MILDEETRLRLAREALARARAQEPIIARLREEFDEVTRKRKELVRRARGLPPLTTDPTGEDRTAAD